MKKLLPFIPFNDKSGLESQARIAEKIIHLQAALNDLHTIRQSGKCSSVNTHQLREENTLLKQQLIILEKMMATVRSLSRF